MPPSNWPTPPAFWDWAAERYGQAPETWLTVQMAGGNVNLALLLAWCDQAAVPAPALATLEPVLAPLEKTLAEFRALRRRLKPQLAEADYQALMRHELALEREQQARLLAAAAQAAPGPLAPGCALRHYLNRLGIAATPTPFGPAE